jgi:hypothetical protein
MADKNSDGALTLCSFNHIIRETKADFNQKIIKITKTLTKGGRQI